MEKSKMYYLAQIAVLNAATIAPENKLEILRELMSQESYNKVFEESEALKKEGE